MTRRPFADLGSPGLQLDLPLFATEAPAPVVDAFPAPSTALRDAPTTPRPAPPMTATMTPPERFEHPQATP